ncbi:uncharacterized protein PHACADRAFT_211444 [Phanerochaete carnosa HHB-10118-sp]|uniref:Uncharacterized protein n=1 Tax=Phanerochaete carnosa (strain HHB-10118-sp) TaxID=650164 RepID=K5W3X5_PHACS|nr:uncharacterized protein PHACADRAFT_211444 [Phanerochaete carnosa HHB-10118-sp]EKM53800.1 hypothetical protein PHACADRAFT_211444 [Phanerochaete carnosa HHB-10118-sp]
MSSNASTQTASVAATQTTTAAQPTPASTHAEAVDLSAQGSTTGEQAAGVENIDDGDGDDDIEELLEEAGLEPRGQKAATTAVKRPPGK